MCFQTAADILAAHTAKITDQAIAANQSAAIKHLLRTKMLMASTGGTKGKFCHVFRCFLGIVRSLSYKVSASSSTSSSTPARPIGDREPMKKMSLLERIRLKEAAKNAISMTIDTEKEKRIARLRKMMQLVSTVRS